MQRDQTGENSGEPPENSESEREAAEDDGSVLCCMAYYRTIITFILNHIVIRMLDICPFEKLWGHIN